MIKDYMTSQGAYIETIFGGGYQSAGVPDLLASWKGMFVAIEVKSPTGKGRASDIQKLKIRSIRKSGGIAFFADDLDDVKSVLRQVNMGVQANQLVYEKDNKYF